MMKNVIAMTIATGLLAGVLPGCSYGMIAPVGDKVVIARQDNFLFGALRKVYVCKVTDTGLANCSTGESP
jgi:hypothetical protein